MAHVRDPRLVDVDPAHQQLLAHLVETQGMTRAMALTGIGRSALLGILARGACLSGTAALLREFVREREAA